MGALAESKRDTKVETKKDLLSKLGIKPEDKVCLIRPNENVVSQIRESGKEIFVITDRVEENCDVILYWIDSAEDIRGKMLEAQDKIKPDGRIWVIAPKREVAQKRNLAFDWKQMQREILKKHLVDNKVAAINEEEYGTQFVIRKEYRSGS